MIRRLWRGLVLLGAVALGAVATLMPPARPDLGELRIVVLQSDDWGLEGWFPDRAAAEALSELSEGLPTRLRPYASSTLESAADVESLGVLLEEFRGQSGLPAVLQANHIVAGPVLDARAAPEETIGWPIHPSGSADGAYARPGLNAAVDAAIAAGCWRPELHGLTHFDLFSYAQARRRGDPLERRARSYGVFAYRGFLRETELASGLPTRAQNVAAMATVLFRRRFGRAPVSVIAPDYRWGPEDEAAWRQQGIRVVQAKREQIQSGPAPRGWWGRFRKWARRAVDLHARDFVYLDRPARLEPYGDVDPAAPQGALEAAAAVRAAWARGEPGIVSIHRVQLSSLDPAIARAGRAQLRTLLRQLTSDGAVAFLVDQEVAQLLRHRWSRLERGGFVIIRNHTGGAIRISVRSGEEPTVVPAGIHLFPRGGPEPQSGAERTGENDG